MLQIYRSLTRGVSRALPGGRKLLHWAGSANETGNVLNDNDNLGVFLSIQRIAIDLARRSYAMPSNNVAQDYHLACCIQTEFFFTVLYLT